MPGLLDGVLEASGFKKYLYVALAVFIGLLLLSEWWLWSDNKELSGKLATAVDQLKDANDKLDKMNSTLLNNEATNSGILGGIAANDGAIGGVQNGLDSAYQNYLHNSQCSGMTIPSTKPGTNTNGSKVSTNIDTGGNVEQTIRQTIIDSTWKVYCQNNQKVVGCVP